MRILSKLMKRIEHVELKRNIASIDDPVLLQILFSCYGYKIRTIERANEKKSFICKSWKIKFISHQPAFVKIDLSSDPKKLLFQEMIFQSKIFERNEGILPLWPTLSNRLVLLITGPTQAFGLALAGYLENSRNLLKNSRNLEKRIFLNLARLLAKLHLKGRELFSEISVLPTGGDFRDLVLSHGDFVRENILIGAKNRIWLTDWENLRVDWPEYDLACFVRDGMDAYRLEIDDPVHRLFFKAYEEHSGLKINYERLRQYLKSFKKI